MKVGVIKKDDGGCIVKYFTQEVLDQLQTGGSLKVKNNETLEQAIEREIQALINETDQDGNIVVIRNREEIEPFVRALAYGGTTEDQAAQLIAIANSPNGVTARITHVENIPTDRYFRDAWTDDNDTETVDIHMEKARIIHMNNLRKLRDKKFLEMGFPVKLDPALEAAIIPGETREKLEALRDMPQSLDLERIKTPEDLKAIWPVELI